MKALTVWQPWAWLIVIGDKPVENRSWATDYKGPMLIHAGKHAFDESCLDMLAQRRELELCHKIIEHFEISIKKGKLVVGNQREFGGLIGAAKLLGCSFGDTKNDLWAADELWHWQYNHPVELPFVPCAGAQSLWEMNMGHYPIDNDFRKALAQWEAEVKANA